MSKALMAAAPPLPRLLLDRRWLLPLPRTDVHRVSVSRDAQECRLDENAGSGDGRHFYLVRDDLLHPTMGGNKLRKLDALLPALKAAGVTDLVTCGGCQSAHTAAIAVAAAQSAIRAHLLLRGEAPAVPTGYNLVSAMFGHITYIPRSEYADREAMLSKHAARVAGATGSIVCLDAAGSLITPRDSSVGSQRVAVVKEGASGPLALLGLIRLVEYLSQHSAALPCSEPLQLVVDCGTGTTAIGLALGVALFGLPWHIVGVMLAETAESYDEHKHSLLSDFNKLYPCVTHLQLPITWIPRQQPRRFGKVLPGEIKACQKIARQTGVMLDPIYTLAAWEAAVSLCLEGHSRVAALHTGGTMGLFGLAQRYPAQFI